MHVVYTVRLEPQRNRRSDLVAWLVIDHGEHHEVHRVRDACQGTGVDSICACADAIDACMAAAEQDWGTPLPWAFPENDDDVRENGRVAWTDGLVRPTPSLLGSEI